MSTALDILFALTFLMTLVAGWRNGFFRELFAGVGLIAGVAGGFRLTDVALAYLPERMRTVPFLPVLAFLIIFLCVYFFMQLLGAVLAKIVEGKSPGGMSRTLGVLAGAVRGAGLLLLFVGALVLVMPRGSRTLCASRVLPHLDRPLRVASSFLPVDVSNRVVRRWDALPFQVSGHRPPSKDQVAERVSSSPR